MKKDKTYVKKSKFLSLVLRHQPEKIGISLDPQGWVDVDYLLAQLKESGQPMSRIELEEVVANNSKKRFAFNEQKTKIRANQGHSVNIDLAYTAIQPPDFLYHGTAQRFIDSILTNGIQKRSRHHVHLSGDEQTAKSVGSRHGKPVILKVKSGLMHEQGLLFYKSDNQVWLTDFVDPKFIIQP